MKAKKPYKIRQNFTLSPRTLECLRIMAERSDLSMSAILSTWILEKWEEAESPQLHTLPAISVKKNGTGE
jgi:hypothetical protein